MTPDLRAVLALDVMQRARPFVAHGADLLDRPVRWVHTSELVEAAELLKGGELLLTTGLGLAGRGPVAQRSYVEALAAHGAAALVLELGWTFTVIPQPLLDSAREQNFPLIALQEIVPFVEITEEIQTRLLQARFAELTYDSEIARLLRTHLLRGDGPPVLAAALAHVLNCPVIVEKCDGYVVASGGLADGQAEERLAKASTLSTTPIDVGGVPWGRIHLVDPPPSSRPLIKSALTHGAAAIALTVPRTSQAVSRAARKRAVFFSEVMSGKLTTPSAVTDRAHALGYHIPVKAVFTGFAVSGHRRDEDEAVASAAKAAAGDYGGALVANLDGFVLGLIRGEQRHDTRQVASRLLESIDAFLRRRGSADQVRLAVGHSIRSPAGIGNTLRQAKVALVLAEDLSLVERAVTARGMLLEQLMAEVSQNALLTSLVDDVLEPLVQHDMAHESEFVKTLHSVLSHGSAKSAVAEALHIRRQTLYQRLARIEELVGPLTDPADRIPLLVALTVRGVSDRVSGELTR